MAGLRFIAKCKLEYQDGLMRLCPLTAVSLGISNNGWWIVIETLPVFFEPILNNQSRDTFEVFLIQIIFSPLVKLM